LSHPLKTARDEPALLWSAQRCETHPKAAATAQAQQLLSCCALMRNPSAGSTRHGSAAHHLQQLLTRSRVRQRSGRADRCSWRTCSSRCSAADVRCARSRAHCATVSAIVSAARHGPAAPRCRRFRRQAPVSKDTRTGPGKIAHLDAARRIVRDGKPGRGPRGRMPAIAARGPPEPPSRVAARAAAAPPRRPGASGRRSSRRCVLRRRAQCRAAAPPRARARSSRRRCWPRC